MTPLTGRQVLAVVHAVLDSAAAVKVAVSSANIFLPAPSVTFVTEDGEAQRLAAALGISHARTHVCSGDPSLTIEVFEGALRGVTLTVQHCIPTEVTS